RHRLSKPSLVDTSEVPNHARGSRYNEVQRRTRCVVDQTFGHLKARFCCLDIFRGALLYSPN
ncbi:hypothetical protein NDU88_004246, partial [Pleurodeles waltl]